MFMDRAYWMSGKWICQSESHNKEGHNAAQMKIEHAETDWYTFVDKGDSI